MSTFPRGSCYSIFFFVWAPSMAKITSGGCSESNIKSRAPVLPSSAWSHRSRFCIGIGFIWFHVSMDWFEGKFTGKHHISWENLWFPVGFPLNQSIECLWLLLLDNGWGLFLRISQVGVLKKRVYSLGNHLAIYLDWLGGLVA